MRDLKELSCVCRACVSFGPRNRSIGAAAKSQVCFLQKLTHKSDKKQDWCFHNAPWWQAQTYCKLPVQLQHRGSIEIINSSFSLIVCVLNIEVLNLLLQTGCHKLQEHSSRVQEVPWQSIFWSICAVPQKQPGLRYCTNAHRNNGHQGKRRMRGRRLIALLNLS